MLLLLKRIRFKYFKNSLTAKQTIVKLFIQHNFLQKCQLANWKSIEILNKNPDLTDVLPNYN